MEALIRIAQHPEAVGDVFNIGATEEITIKELACLVKEMARSSSEIRYIHYDEAYEEGFEDIPRRVPDLSKITRLIGFRPTRGASGDFAGPDRLFERGPLIGRSPR